MTSSWTRSSWYSSSHLVQSVPSPLGLPLERACTGRGPDTAAVAEGRCAPSHIIPNRTQKSGCAALFSRAVVSVRASGWLRMRIPRALPAGPRPSPRLRSGAQSWSSSSSSGGGGGGGEMAATVLAAPEGGSAVMQAGNAAACTPPPGPSGPGSWNRSLDRALEEAAASGTLSLSGRKLRDYPRASAANHDLSDTTQAGEGRGAAGSETAGTRSRGNALPCLRKHLRAGGSRCRGSSGSPWERAREGCLSRRVPRRVLGWEGDSQSPARNVAELVSSLSLQ